jgi:tetratricopeptide (TPR) repeat protein
MGESLKSEATVRAYLLGRVSDEATLEGIEELLFTDDEFCTHVALAEDTLINEYVLGRLAEADADSFRSTLERNPDRLFKLRLTQKLRETALAHRPETARAESPEVLREVARAGDAQTEVTRAGVARGGGARDFGTRDENVRDEGVRAKGVRAGDGPGLFDSLKALLRRPRYAAAFASVLVAATASAVYFARRGDPDQLAELRAVYARERPTETRLSGFGHAPLPQLRGEPEPAERNRLRRLENGLIDEAEENPSARTRHALGLFYLTQSKHADAVRELEAAAKLAGGDAKIHNDLGAAHFESAKASAQEKRLEALARALEEFTRATELDPDSLEALFNRSLALQELGARREARESWELYLRKDSSSPWAEEARRHLSRLGDEGSRLKRDDEVLRDFLEAYRRGDDARALKIHDETKGLLRGPAVPLQLSRRLLLARRRGDDAEAAESLAALAYLGDSEQSRHSDFFFLS